MSNVGVKISAKDNRLLRTFREESFRSKPQMKKLAKIYNKYHEKKDWITNCMCSKVGRKIYHEIIYAWYDTTTH